MNCSSDMMGNIYTTHQNTTTATMTVSRKSITVEV